MTVTDDIKMVVTHDGHEHQPIYTAMLTNYFFKPGTYWVYENQIASMTVLL